MEPFKDVTFSMCPKLFNKKKNISLPAIAIAGISNNSVRNSNHSIPALFRKAIHQ